MTLIETVVFILSYGALERSNNPHIESIVSPCVYQNKKQVLTMWV